MPQVIVVGGGICGLQLSALFASDGREVLVLEKQSRVGGRAFLWDKDGFTVDNGIHLIRFGPQSSIAQVFRHLGKPIEFVDLGKSYVGFPDGTKVDFPTSPGGFLTTKLMSVGERLKAIPLMLKIRKGTPFYLLDVSVKKWLADSGIKGGMAKYLHLVSASMQVCPFLERASAGEMLLNMQAVLVKRRSAMYPTRGWRYIYDALLETIKQKGEARTGAEVSRVIVENGKAKGVELSSGEKIMAEQVVVNLPVQELSQVVDEGLLPPEYAKLCRSLRPTAGVVLDYGLDKKISDDSGLWYFWDPMSFGMFTSNLCPGVAPAGKQLLTWFLPANVEEMADPTKAKALENKLEAEILKFFPALEEAKQWRRAMHLKMVDGVEVNVDQHRKKRPGFSVPGIEGLWLVGDSLAAPGAGGDVGHESVLGCYREMTGKPV